MTTKTKWRLKELPEPSEVALLLKEGIITKEEAREILISQETDDDRDKKSLQDEIKFLRDLVNSLSTRSTIVEQIRYIEKPYIRYDWWQPYQVYCSTGANTTNAVYTASGSTTVNLNAGTSGTLTATSWASEPDFNDIKTF